MSEAPPPVRVRSGLSLPLPTGWRVIDTLEALSPEGVRLSAASYPVDPGVDLALLVAADVVPGAEAIGAAEGATLFGDRAGLVQRFDSTVADGGFSQLSGYALAGDRLFVVRATCGRGQFEQLAPSMRASLTAVGIDGPPAIASSPARDDGPSTTFDRYLAGHTLCALPERVVVEVTTMSTAWDAESPSQTASPTATQIVLTTAELSALAHLYGQSAFPGTRRPSPSTAAAVEAAGRSALLARGLVRFATADDFEVDEAVHLVVSLAFQADLIVDVDVTGIDPVRCAYFAGARGSLRVERHDGDVHVCTPIATDGLFADLIATTGTLSDDGDGPPELLHGATDDSTTVDRQLLLRRAVVDADRIELDNVSMFSIRGFGCYATDDSGPWLRVSPSEQRRRMLDAIVS